MSWELSEPTGGRFFCGGAQSEVLQLQTAPPSGGGGYFGLSHKKDNKIIF